MADLKRFLMMAEDELTQYSTDARKIEKLRQKIALSVSNVEQDRLRAELVAEFPTDGISQLLTEQRQTVALPFWGIAGLGLLLGISQFQSLDFIATLAGGAIAITVQRRGWKLQAQKLLLDTFDDLARSRPGNSSKTS